jgi:mannan endo-1,4-beta-mannosidase
MSPNLGLIAPACHVMPTMAGCLLAAVSFCAPCAFSQPVDKNATPETKALFNTLLEHTGANHTLFGQYKATWAGRNFQMEHDRCDILDVTGDYPAVNEFHACDALGSEKAFAYCIEQIKRDHSRGMISGFLWRMGNPVTGGKVDDIDLEPESLLPAGKNHAKWEAKLDEFGELAKACVDNSGRPIPLLFRFLAEMNAGKSRWYKPRITPPEVYKELWRDAVMHCQERGIHNLLWVYNPQSYNLTDVEAYLTHYAGDDYVDVCGCNVWLGEEANEATEIAQLQIAYDVGTGAGKVVAVCQTGRQSGIGGSPRQADYWMGVWFKAFAREKAWTKMAYASAWRNSPENFWTPYKGHSGVEDFRQFCKQPEIWLLEDAKNGEQIEDE